MADVSLLAPFIFKWEGGFSNRKSDRGGATNMGVTLNTWRSVGYDKTGDGVIDVEDLKLLSKEEVVTRVLKPHYWDRFHGDDIHSQSVANVLVDWLWGSGAHAIRKTQRLLGVQPDGVVGPKTLAAINAFSPALLFNEIKNLRKEFYEAIVRNDASQKVNLKGWLNRLNDLSFSD